MGYSSIIQKKCKCGCSKFPTMGFQGYNADCRPDLKKEKLEKHKKRQAIMQDGTSIRKLAAPAADQKVDDAQMQLYWMLAKKELAKNPKCMECGEFIPEKIKQIGNRSKTDGCER